MSTGMSNYLSKQNQVSAFKTEQAQQEERQQKLMDLKLKIALELPIDSQPLNEE